MKPRREPRFAPFVVTGALLGILIGLVAAVRGPEAQGYTTAATLGYFASLGGLVGALLGGAVAAVLSRGD